MGGELQQCTFVLDVRGGENLSKTRDTHTRDSSLAEHLIEWRRREDACTSASSSTTNHDGCHRQPMHYCTYMLSTTNERIRP